LDRHSCSIRYHPESELQQDEDEEAGRKKEIVKETMKKSKKRERDGSWELEDPCKQGKEASSSETSGNRHADLR
jgi:hypothetical protein